MEAIDPFVFRLSIFVLAIFVGYFVVWSVTPALHTPLMAVTNAISSVIVVGALIAVSVPTHPPSSVNTGHGVIHIGILGTGTQGLPSGVELVPRPDSEPGKATTYVAVRSTDIQNAWISKSLGLLALILASVNIFGGFLVTSRMLAMYKKKEK